MMDVGLVNDGPVTMFHDSRGDLEREEKGEDKSNSNNNTNDNSANEDKC
jgi:hypothetical protein